MRRIIAMLMLLLYAVIGTANQTSTKMSLFNINELSQKSPGEKVSILSINSTIPDSIVNKISEGKTIHYVSHGKINTNDLLFRVLKETGPAHLNISTWSIGSYVANQFVNKYKKEVFLSCKFLFDKRILNNHLQPYNLIKKYFDHRLTKIHAKVILLQNENYKMSYYRYISNIFKLDFSFFLNA